MHFSRGVVYMLVAVLFFSSMGLLIKWLPEIPAAEIVFFRSLISLVLSYGMLKYQKVAVLGKKKKYLVLRGLFGAGALMLFIETLQSIPLASAVVIGYLSPIFATIFGIFVVKEKVAPFQWLCFGLSFVGILIVEGFDSRVPPEYLAIGLCACIFSGLAQNYIRKVNTTEHPLVIIFYFPLVTLPIASLYCIFFDWVAPNGIQLLLLISIGFITQFAQFFMTKSLQLEELSKVAILRYLSIVNALAFGYFFFGETYEWWAFVGMGLTILGVLLNVYYKNKKAKETSSA